MNAPEARNRACILNIRGEMTASAREAITDAYHQAHEQGFCCVILDFTGMEYINSDGASLLVKLRVQERQRKQEVRAFGLSEQYRSVFKATNLDEAVRVYDSLSEALSAAEALLGGSLLTETRELAATASATSAKRRQRGDGGNWAQPVPRLRVPEMPPEAINLNVDGRRAVGPVRGFGQMWEKTYRLRLTGSKSSPTDVIDVLKENFPRLQPPENHFYPSAAGIQPGEVVLINSSTPGGPVYTAVVVLYADEESFTFITPQGHPESGWVTFSALEEDSGTVAQIQGLARANDPIYEIAFRLAGSKIQERIWRHVLTSLAMHLGVEAEVEIQKTCVDPKLQWSEAGNVWYNAQIRSLVYAAVAPLRWVRRILKR